RYPQRVRLAVVVDWATSGTITPSGLITVSGQVRGSLPQADVLTVGGNATSFNPSTGAFSTSVALGQTVNVVDATVQSIGLGTSDTDSVVVLKGNALGLGSRVPTGNFNRLNNSGFLHVPSVIESKLDPAFAPAQFVGMSFGGHKILGFSTGAKSAAVTGGGAHTVATTISIDNLHLDADAGSGCTVHYGAANVTINAPADLL